jgi:hypothetical protein
MSSRQAVPQRALLWLDSLYGGEQGGRSRQLTGTLLSVAVHSLLLWAVLARFNSVAADSTPSSQYGALQLLQLDRKDSDPGADIGKTSAPASASKPSDDSSVQKSPLDTVVDTSVTPIWAVPTAAPTQSVAAPAQQGGIGGSSYDPYAGAAPIRRTESDTAAMMFGPAPADTQAATVVAELPPPDRRSRLFELDKRAFEQFRVDVVRLLSGVSGMVRLRVRVASDGSVVEAQARKASLNPDQTASVARLITGRALFYLREPTAEGAIIDLPRLDLDA